MRRWTASIWLESHLLPSSQHTPLRKKAKSFPHVSALFGSHMLSRAFQTQTLSRMLEVWWSLNIYLEGCQNIRQIEMPGGWKWHRHIPQIERCSEGCTGIRTACWTAPCTAPYTAPCQNICPIHCDDMCLYLSGIVRIYDTFGSTWSKAIVDFERRLGVETATP